VGSYRRVLIAAIDLANGASGGMVLPRKHGSNHSGGCNSDGRRGVHGEKSRDMKYKVLGQPEGLMLPRRPV
jgi:hypothetical protein